jgi:hypothetical protein
VHCKRFIAVQQNRLNQATGRGIPKIIQLINALRNTSSSSSSFGVIFK